MTINGNSGPYVPPIYPDLLKMPVYEPTGYRAPGRIVLLRERRGRTDYVLAA